MKSPVNILIALLVIGIILVQSIFIVSEGEKALVTRFAKVIRDSEGQLVIYEPGAHFKVPFLDKVKILDAKIQTLNSTEDRFVTVEKKDLIIDSYVKWQIQDFVKFYLSTKGDRYQAEVLLRNKITNSLRSQIGLLSIKEIVSGKSSESEKVEANEAQDTEMYDSKRDQVMQNALAATSESAKDLGIKIIDVRIMKINLPKEVSNSIYQRMRAERDAVAKLHRSQGRQEAEAIRANADRQAVIKLAEAEMQAKTIKAQGEAEATNIYASSYSKNADLFDFLKSMDAYSVSMEKGGNIIVTDSKNGFMKQFR